jgi:type IV pilus assembly protein PilB
MGLISLLNRTFRWHLLSAPLAAVASGAEGVSVVHPIETHNASAQEETKPSETMPSEDVSAEEEDQPTTLPDTEELTRIIAQYYQDQGVDTETDVQSTGQNGKEDAPIVRLANTIIQQAIKERTSDIHIELLARYVRVRYRIDGVLQEAYPMPRYLWSPLIHRYKILAGIDIATHRGQPQEGRVPIRYKGADYNIRVNTQPTQSGEHLTLHIDNFRDSQVGFAKLGFVPEMQAQLENLALSPRGLLLLTGPSGSGKTTLQYAVLNHFNTVGVHIATVEERASHRLFGATQIVVDASENGTLGSAIRAAVQHDIDVLSISEIKDKPTAQAAFDVAAGSFVVATIRGDNTLSTLIRLREMGFDAGLITETVCGVIAQRLVRKICSHCKETYEVASKELDRFGLLYDSPEDKVMLARGVGCEYCRHSGYLGRVGLYEVFQWEPTIAKMFADRVSLPHLKEAAVWNGRMHGLKEDGLVKIFAHLTTPQEVLRML